MTNADTASIGERRRVHSGSRRVDVHLDREQLRELLRSLGFVKGVFAKLAARKTSERAGE